MDPVYSVLVQFYFHFFICDQNASERKCVKKNDMNGLYIKDHRRSFNIHTCIIHCKVYIGEEKNGTFCFALVLYLS